MPYDLFWWEGLDGSRVLAHTFNNPVGGYNAETGARAVLETWKNYRGKHAFGESLLAFGYGDGGGGPTEEMLDRQRQFADFPVVPSLRPTKIADWFAKARAAVEDDPKLPVWVGEMYLELHRGTLTTQGRTKYLHRKAERALITAETLSSMATLLGEGDRRVARAALAGAAPQRVPRHPAGLEHPRGLPARRGGALRRRRRRRQGERRPARRDRASASCRPATGPACWR